jgi:hypothetical protein
VRLLYINRVDKIIKTSIQNPISFILRPYFISLTPKTLIMKSLRTLVSIAVLGTIVALSGCGGGKGNVESTTDKQLSLLSKTWKVSSVTQDSNAPTDDWSNFTITISGTKGSKTFDYSCSGRPALSPWKVSGSFQFDDAQPTSIVKRDDGASVTYSVDPASANLTMSFTFSGTGYSRVANVSGDWVFKMVPKP